MCDVTSEASVGSEVGTRDIVPELARVTEDIPNHVCECGIVREKFLKTETRQNVPSFNHETGAAVYTFFRSNSEKSK